MSDTHAKIIASAAKTELASLGFRQVGRSRLWLADRGTWLNVVEFTPSRWAKSVSLMNAAHWLWLGDGFMSFNEAIPSNRHAEFASEAQFEEAAIEIARVARSTALEIEQRFSSFDAVAAFVIARARGSPDGMGPSWWGYEAGIASGLVGNAADADYFLTSVTDERVTNLAASFLPLIHRPDAFKNRVNTLVAQERARLKLKAMDGPPF